MTNAGNVPSTSTPEQELVRLLESKSASRAGAIFLIIVIIGTMLLFAYGFWYTTTPSQCPEPCYGELALVAVLFTAVPVLMILLVIAILLGIRWYDRTVRIAALRATMGAGSSVAKD